LLTYFTPSDGVLPVPGVEDHIQVLENKINVMQNHIEELLGRNKKANQDFDSLNETLKR
jgi:peptidoglycan hydrolase CwlO-like protein